MLFRSAVLAPAAVQRVEDRVRLRRQRLHQRAEVAAEVDLAHRVDLTAQRLRAGVPGVQRHPALGRAAALQHRDAPAHAAPPAGTPSRLITHLSMMPAPALTRRPPSPPRFPWSAAVAFRVLTREGRKSAGG